MRYPKRIIELAIPIDHPALLNILHARMQAHSSGYHGGTFSGGQWTGTTPLWSKYVNALHDVMMKRKEEPLLFYLIDK